MADKYNRKVYATIGASNHTDSEREENDYYATDPIAIKLLLDECKEEFSHKIWEPCCGEGHLSKELEARGYDVLSSDLIFRGYGIGGYDFLEQSTIWDGDIITNPPYKYAKEFVEHAFNLIEDGHKVAMFLKLTFLEGKQRKELFKKCPLKCLYVSSSRILCAKNGDFDYMKQHGGSALAYGWFVFEKGYEGEPTIRWFN